MTTDHQWYKDAIFYELQVKSFFDSNADGIGDFRGLVEKLDYLKDLGVDCIWVTPFFPSPLKDDGYDISYRGSRIPSKRCFRHADSPTRLDRGRLECCVLAAVGRG